MPLPYHWQMRVERWKRQFRGLFGSNEEQAQPRPKICPACGSLVGISATRCHECGASLTFSMAALSKKFSGIFGDHATPVTTALLVANFMMLGLSWVAVSSQGGGGLDILWGMGGYAALYRFGTSFWPPVYYLNEWWRLITATFLHDGLIHIGFNMMALMQFGPALEELYGSSRFLFIYAATGAFGYLVSSFFGNYSLGASGAILGLVGVMLAVTSKRGGGYMRDLRSRLISSVVLLFVLGFMRFGMDNYAHGGGLFLGFIFGKMFADRQPMNGREQKVALALGWIAGIAIVLSFGLMILHYRDPVPAGLK